MGILWPERLVLTARGATVAAACLMLANCASSNKFASRVDPKYGVSSSPRVVAFGEPVPKGGGTYRVGKPYTVAGRVYVPEEDTDYREEGMASWYGDDFHGRLTANGEVFDMASLSAAHPTLPMPCYARVTNMRNGKSLIVRVNDRGPYHGNRLIDVSNRAAELLEFKGSGVARVRVGTRTMTAMRRISGLCRPTRRSIRAGPVNCWLAAGFIEFRGPLSRKAACPESTAPVSATADGLGALDAAAGPCLRELQWCG